ncbi:MAG TPA: LLM class F420-dependent oxidoreductase [Methylomirabilota bacterium]|nr:LLM class F420-dependent oxidoreductase [Methylomirabilota bacterium]
MEFGLSLPGRGPFATLDTVLKIATRAEALRFSSLFVTDHIVLPVKTDASIYPYAASGRFPGGSQQDYLEPLVLLGYLAHVTRTLRLGTSVLVIPYRNPLLTAKMLAMIDVLSRGRLILGAGTGWLKEEFEAVGAPPFEERGRVTDEYLSLMRRVWTTDPVTFEGRYATVREVHALPKPAQRGGIPIWIGGHTDAALRRAARLGDGWHPIGLRPPALLYPDEYGTRVAQLQAYARQAGRDPRAITLSFRAPMEVRGPRDRAPAGERPLFQGTAAEVASDIRRYQSLGVTHFVFDPVRPALGKVLASMERFAHDVLPKLKTGRRHPAARSTSINRKSERSHAAPSSSPINRKNERSRPAPRTGHPRSKPASRPPIQ